MSDMEIKEFVDRIRAMTEEEKKIIVKLLPSGFMWDELRRRDEKKDDIIFGIKELVREQ